MEYSGKEGLLSTPLEDKIPVALQADEGLV